jgi:uncharacterized protein (TIGR02757 family)
MDHSNSECLLTILDKLYRNYQNRYLVMDPLELVRCYDDSADQEVAAFIAAGLAIGQSDLIRKTVKQVLDRLQPSPYRFIRGAAPAVIQEKFQTFRYRFYGARDIGLLLWWITQMVETAGSIRKFFLQTYSADEKDIGPSLSRFVRAVLRLKAAPFYSHIQKGQGIRHFLSDPEDGSACKRLNLYLRWMVRKDNLDLGLWPEISTRQLVIPLDTHIARFGSNLGLTRRSSMDWRMAQDITETLRQFDPSDPVKYDFALCTLGKLTGCARISDPVHCETCPVFQLCNAAAIRH